MPLSDQSSSPLTPLEVDYGLQLLDEAIEENIARLKRMTPRPDVADLARMIGAQERVARVRVEVRRLAQ